MPRMDGTGPTGGGPLTGRGRGKCGQAGGRAVTLSKEEQKKVLLEEKKIIEDRLKELE